MDNTLERLNNELQKAQAELARTRKKRKDLNTLLIKEEDKSVDKRSAESIASLNEQIYDCDALILQCNTKIEDLRSKIEAHTKKFYSMMDERIKFGEEVDATNKGWSDFDDALDGIQRALSGY